MVNALTPLAVKTGYGTAKFLCLAVCVFGAFLLLQGCYGKEPPPPEPFVNPHPHETTKLKITVAPDSGVNNVEVDSIWAIGNIGCAPHQAWPSGASIQKEVYPEEKVEKIGPYDYVATIVDDRFLPDKCEWYGGGYEIDFMHGDKDLSTMGTGLSDIEQAGVLKLTCASKISPSIPPLCMMKDQEAFMRSRFSGVFNATVEIEK